MTAAFPTTPICLPVPSILLLFSPHPDDISISLGALTQLATAAGVSTEMLMLTDGSEAAISPRFLTRFGWTPAWSPTETKSLRGRIRMSEAVEEGIRLGIPARSVRLLNDQQWHAGHITPPSHMNIDLSIRDLGGYKAGALTEASIKAIADELVRHSAGPILCAVPDPNDRFAMHRTTTASVAEAMLRLPVGILGNIGVITYRCLSTLAERALKPSLFLGFDTDIMKRKVHAILAHQSMLDRRITFGGYGNVGTEFYDTLTERWNAETARAAGLHEMYAEEFGWAQTATPPTIQRLRDMAIRSFHADTEVDINTT